MLKLFNALLLAAALSACVGRQPTVYSPNLTVLQNSSALPAPDHNGLTADARPSLIGLLDTIAVDVFNIPDLSWEIQRDSPQRRLFPDFVPLSQLIARPIIALLQ